MASTFSLILAIVTLLTGIIWTVDKLVWSKQRAAKIAAARASAGSNIDEKTLAKVAPCRSGSSRPAVSSRSSRWC